MLEVLLIVALVLLVAILIMLVLLRSGARKPAQVVAQLDSLEKGLERVNRSLRDEIANNRQEAREDARSQRDEVSVSLKNFNDSIFKVVSETSAAQKIELTAFGESLQAQVNGIAGLLTGQLQTKRLPSAVEVPDSITEGTTRKSTWNAKSKPETFGGLPPQGAGSVTVDEEETRVHQPKKGDATARVAVV
jgi:ABC-type Na+ efflux pump permease subunit